jgi:hypothetical protein
VTFIRQQFLEYSGREAELECVADAIALLRAGDVDAAVAILVKYHDALEAGCKPKLVPYDQRTHD